MIGVSCNLVPVVFCNKLIGPCSIRTNDSLLTNIERLNLAPFLYIKKKHYFQINFPILPNFILSNQFFRKGKKTQI